MVVFLVQQGPLGRSLGGSEANFLAFCFGRALRKLPPETPKLPRSPSRSFSSHEVGWKIILISLKALSILIKEIKVFLLN